MKEGEEKKENEKVVGHRKNLCLARLVDRSL